MRQEFIDLYDDFTHRGLDRRVFMRRLAELAGGTAAAAALVPLLEANSARAAMVAPDAAGITSSRVAIPTASGELKGSLVTPADATGQLPSVIIVHENRGLNAHIEDVARRAALAGFVALAPDFLSSMGGTPTNEDQAREMIGKLSADTVTAEARSAIDWLKAQSDSNGKVGIVGFCWGGGVVGRVAVAAPELGAGVVFYGQAPASEGVADIKAPLLLNYAGLDERINAGIPAFEEALKSAGTTYQLYIYDGVNHAFHNDTSEARYNKEAAELAWQRTIDFFKQNLAA
jgi:carboxymethylenebutenolidase